MDERDDVDSRRQGTREERLRCQRFKRRLDEEERDGCDRQDAQRRIGTIRDADSGQDEERGSDSGAAPVHHEIRRERVDGEGGETSAQRQARDQEPPILPELQPDREREQHAGVEGRHP
jgi:hypothetical protein